MVTQLNATTKKAQYFIDTYIKAHKSSKTTLRDYYIHPSAKKCNIFNTLYDKYTDLWRSNRISTLKSPYYCAPIVTGASCHQFTVMYIAPHPSRPLYCLYVETAHNTYIIYVEDDVRLFKFFYTFIKED